MGIIRLLKGWRGRRREPAWGYEVFRAAGRAQARTCRPAQLRHAGRDERCCPGSWRDADGRRRFLRWRMFHPQISQTMQIDTKMARPRGIVPKERDSEGRHSQSLGWSRPSGRSPPLHDLTSLAAQRSRKPFLKHLAADMFTEHPTRVGRTTFPLGRSLTGLSEVCRLVRQHEGAPRINPAPLSGDRRSQSRSHRRVRRLPERPRNPAGSPGLGNDPPALAACPGRLSRRAWSKALSRFARL